MAIKSTDFIGSLAKGFVVLEAFSAERPRMSVSEAAEATCLDRAAARRCLLTLTELGYAQYDGKYFSLTPKILRLGVSAQSSMQLANLVQPWLDQLSGKIGESVSVAILDGNEITYLARASQQRVMSIGLMPGSRLPAHCTSLGRVLLSELNSSQVREIIRNSDLSPRTIHSLSNPDQILEEIARVQQQGYALVDQEIEIGLRSLAVPLANGAGQVQAALNVGVSAAQVSARTLVTEHLPEMRQVQEGVRNLLF